MAVIIPHVQRPSTAIKMPFDHSTRRLELSAAHAVCFTHGLALQCIALVFRLVIVSVSLY
eukprot:m.60403 g.60403  ORF g.60403 m.60403 type:complete len:60 (+) comp13285_c0_seq1:385-564(+)